MPNFGGLVLRAPEWLWAFLLFPLLVPLALRSLSGLPLWRRLLSLLVRSLLLACLVVALARPAERGGSTLTSTVFLADVSDSMTDEDLARMSGYLSEVRKDHGEHHVEFVSFARDARRLSFPPTPPVKLERHVDGSATDMQGALSLGLGLLMPERIGQLVLLSDGHETRGDLAHVSAQLSRLGVSLFVVPSSGALPPEIAVEALDVPEHPTVGQPFLVRVRIASTVAQRARVKLLQNGLLNGLDGARDVELPRGRTELSFRALAHVSGPLTYRVELLPEGPDRFGQNNTFTRTCMAIGNPRVLYAEVASGEAAPFQGLLNAAGFDVDVRSGRGFPSDLRELRAFDFAILSDVPREQLSQTSLQAIEAYLNDGGGFLMAGGEQSFGLGGYRNTSLESLLPVRLDTERRRDQPSLALVLVIDKSGSMNGEKIELAKEAARATSELLGAEDFLGVIGFDAEPDRVVRLASASNRLGISRGIGRLAAGGGTQIFPALDAAYADLLGVRARVKHVILLTDGQTQEKGLPLLIQNMQVDGITVSTIGLGDDVNRSLIEDLAKLGHGRAYFTVDPSSVPRLFVKETHAVARSSAVEDYVGLNVTSPADFLRGLPMDSAPLLRGYVATRARPSPAQVILSSELGEPVLARMRVGLGWSLAWTSDVKPRWSSAWFSWKAHSVFWAQLIREHMRTRRDDA
jgi:Ca-activated chloride channel family protein